jgi:hypothetical protein
MNTFVKSCISVLVVSLLASTASAGERPQPLAGQDDVVGKALDPCPGGLERFLPGEYYFCAATQAFWSGRQDHAIEMMLDAARWGSKPAQYALGIMYFNGDRVAANRPLGLAWLALASERHDPQYEPAFVSAYGKSSEQQRAQANVLWQTMKPIYSDDVAATRALTRFKREMRPLEYGANFGGSMYIDGVTAPPFVENTYGEFATASTFYVQHLLNYRAANYFYGWHENVQVGNMQLIPIAEAVRATQDAHQP